MKRVQLILIMAIMLLVSIACNNDARRFVYDASQIDSIEIVDLSNKKSVTLSKSKSLQEVETFLNDFADIPFRKYDEDCKCKGDFNITFNFNDLKTITFDGYTVVESGKTILRYKADIEALCEKYLMI